LKSEIRSAVSTVLKWLTIASRVGAVTADSPLIGAESTYFPFVGLAKGLILLLINRILDNYLAIGLLAVLCEKIFVVTSGCGSTRIPQRRLKTLESEVQEWRCEPICSYDFIVVFA